MAWDDLSDMWWMQKPDRSNLPELAVGAFMQGMGQAQRRAEFNAELPMRIAESQARTAAQVAQTDIATKKFERENSEWERIAKQEPVFADYSKKIANWISDPLNKSAVPEAPVDLTDEFRSKADKMMVDAALMKRQENLKGLAVQATLKDQEDKLDLVTNYGLGLQQANDPVALEMAKLRRAENKALQLESKYGVTIPKEGIKIPMTPAGDLDVVAYEAIIKRMAPAAVMPADATKMSYKDAQGREITVEKDKTSGTKTADEIEKARIEFITKQAAAGVSPVESQKQWDSIMKMKGGAPEIGTVVENPLMYQPKLNVPVSGAYVKIPKGTKLGGVTYEEDTVRWFAPPQAGSAPTDEPRETTLPSGQTYSFTTGNPEQVQKLEKKVVDIRKQLQSMGTSAPAQKTMALGVGAQPVTIPTSTAERKSYDNRVKKLLKDLSEAEEQLRNAQGK